MIFAIKGRVGFINAPFRVVCTFIPDEQKYLAMRNFPLDTMKKTAGGGVFHVIPTGNAIAVEFVSNAAH